MQVTIHFDLGRARDKRWVLRLGLPFLAICAGGVALAASLPKSWKTGDALTASDLNSNFGSLDSRISALEARAMTPSGFTATFSVGGIALKQYQSPNLVFDKELFDLNDEYDPTRGTFTAKNAGTYLLACGYWLSASAGGLVYSSGLTVNGSTQLGAADTHSSWAGGLNVSVVTVANLAAGDELTCHSYTSDASGTIPNQHLDSDRFSAVRLN